MNLRTLFLLALVVFVLGTDAQLAETLNKVPLSQLGGAQSCEGSKIWIKLFFLGDHNWSQTSSRVMLSRASSSSVVISPSQNYSICSPYEFNFLFFRDPFRLADGNLIILTNGQVFANLSSETYAQQSSNSISSFIGQPITGSLAIQTNFPTMAPSAAPTLICSAPHKLLEFDFYRDEAEGHARWTLFSLDANGVGTSLQEGTESWDGCLGPGDYAFQLLDCSAAHQGDVEYRLYLDETIIRNATFVILSDSVRFQVTE